MHLSLKKKILLLTLVPLLLFAAVLSGTASQVLIGLAESEVTEARERLLEESRSRLIDYASIAQSMLAPLYQETAEGDMRSRAQAVRLLSAIKYGKDGYFFGYDSDVVRIFRGDSSEGVGTNMRDRKDKNGVYLNRDMVAAAKDGTHFIHYTGAVVGTDQVVPKLAYGFYLPKWDLVVLTAVNLDGIDAQVAQIRQRIEARTEGIVSIIVAVALAAILVLGALAPFMVKASLRPLGKISASLDEIASGEGDLTQRLPVTSRDEIGQLAGSFNRFLDSIHGLVRQITDITAELTTRGAQVTTQARRAEQAMQQQRQETDQVATAINEMSASALEVSASAQRAANAAQEADRQGRDARHVVDGSIEHIHGLVTDIQTSSGSLDSLQEDVSSISNVLDVIRSIAEQTNLLALNAAIEAARAGDAGRGFAVVADEVRALAGRTQQSTQEIQAMIDRLQGGTRNAVAAMGQSSEAGRRASEHANQAERALVTIADLIATINAMNAQIACAAEEQTSVAEQINRSVQQIAQSVDQVADETLRSTQTIEALNALGGRLGTLVHRFKV
ncbi:cache domain-containing protein [Pseudomonas sp. LPB0260]|nr:methyl-accepting chemotaxis protein [Pseudomonas sp. LPB0260]QLC72673.1 cache domain-containing protein [Pseudomonas sp. LPB0260]QLC75447.1 cache domain-containing protein [Pseudomonas sp. LPB0260]